MGGLVGAFARARTEFMWWRMHEGWKDGGRENGLYSAGQEKGQKIV
jgi:hypothetical protein